MPGKMKSAMKHDFARVPSAQIERSSFRRPSSYKTTFDAGYLIPFWVDEALPGDTFNLDCGVFARLATPIFPIMDNMRLSMFFFFCPNRLLWNNWEKMCGSQVDPGDSTDFTFPVIPSTAGTGLLINTLGDYFGLPLAVAGLNFVSLWHRMYNRTWNEWFRDENLQDSVTVDLDDGPDTDADYVVLRRGKRKDYLTGCLPWPQKGTAVELPLGTRAPVHGIGKFTENHTGVNQLAYETDVVAQQTYAEGTEIGAAGNDGIVYLEEDPNNVGRPNIHADLSSATAATINELREAMQLQRLYERDARGGTRYTEVVRAHFRVTSPDSRLQRVEYLGGSVADVEITQVPQTSETGATPQGTQSAYGTIRARGGFTKSFTEHGCLMGILCVDADLTYQEGIPRMFSRSTRFDMYWPVLAHLSEQAVLNKEVWSDASANDDLVFGYQERYAEYRYAQSKITGELRSTAPAPLDEWHLAEEFGALPALSAAFITSKPPVDRIIAVAGTHFILDSFIDLKCARPMPMYGVPGQMDHF